MALPKLFQRIFWHNNTTPAINEDNLNAISKAVNDIDDRVIDLAGTIMEDVPEIQHDLEILEPAIENIDANVERAETAADNAEEEALKSEGYAVGKQDGVEVTSGEYYQNNAKYYAEIANPPIENTVDFADIITISDAINKAAKDVRLKVEPVQDLHGYTKPWVGGAGKNVLPLTVAILKSNNTVGTWSGNNYTINGVTFSVQTDADNNVVGIKATGSATADAYIDADYVAIAQYIINGCPANGSGTTYFLQARLVNGNTWFGARYDLGSGYTFTAADVAGATRFLTRIQVCNGYAIPSSGLLFKPMVSTSGGDFEPYTNICPITGWDNAKVTRSGKNILPVTATTTTDHGVTFTVNADKTITVNGTADGMAALNVSQNIPLKPNNYILSGNGATNIVWNSLNLYNGSTLVETIDLSSATSSDVPLNLASKTFNNVTLSVKRKTNGAVSGTIAPMIRLASVTDETYEPYQGKEITIDLGGTRYGGTLDVTSGVLTLDSVITEPTEFTAKSGTTSNNLYQTDAYANIGTTVALMSQAICNRFEYVDYSTLYGNDVKAFSITSDGKIGIGLGLDGPSTLNDANTWLSNNPLQIVYELATPQTIQLTPTQVYLLYGYNTLFGDCGDISLTYDASGIIHIAEAKLDTETLKAIAAASSDFADFKARIAAL